MSRPTSCSKQGQTRLLRALCKHLWITFQERHRAHSLGKTFQCLTSLMLEKFLPLSSLSVSCFSPLPLVLVSWT